MNLLRLKRTRIIVGALAGWFGVGGLSAVHAAETVSPPQFSAGRGFYFAPVDLQIWCATPGAKLVITTDGSEPGPTHGRMTESDSFTMRLTSNTVLRAATFRAGWLPSELITHTYLFPASTARQSKPPDAAESWRDQKAVVLADFGMDARVIDHPLRGYELTNALMALPSISLVLPNQDLFGSSNGIYVHSLAMGKEWLRRGSVELLYPDGRTGFQASAGLRLHGGASRFPSFTPKHGFAALFRKEFGSGHLDFPILPDSPRRQFNRLVLRAGSCDSWPVTHWPQQIINGEQRWVRDGAVYVRDQWVRDTQRAMGQPAAHGTFAHLYLNGLYWGLYNLLERPDDDFAAAYLGGNEKDYDVISDGTDLHAGNRNAWDQLRSATGLEDDARFQRLLGCNADGSRNPNYPVLLDVTNLVDYMVLHIFIGADDWPEHNWWVARDRSPRSTGFKFFAWDQEIAVNSLAKQHTAWQLLRGGSPFYAEERTANTPAEVYSHCRANAEFRQLFADRVQKHLFNGGALTVTSNVLRWQQLTNVIDCAIVAESARWGDYQRPAQPFRREVEWIATNHWQCSIFFPSNHFIALKRFQDAGLFPRVLAPDFRPHGGVVARGWPLSITNQNSGGTIYFTTDGTDPRARGGAVSPSARAYVNAHPVQNSTTVKARVQSGTIWSALVEARFETVSAK